MVDDGKEGSGLLSTLGEMRSYTIIWSGQLVSLIGSGMTIFALLVWLYERTGQATSVSLLFLFAFGPEVVLAPLAGVVVDRYSRKAVLLMSDGLTAVSTMSILVVHLMGMLSPWSLYGLISIAGACSAFQFPALTAATTLIVPKRHYGRASGMLSTAWALSHMLAPIMAAVLLSRVGLAAVMAIDLMTFGAALFTLAIVTIPKPRGMKEGEEAKASWGEDLTFGWKYILARKSLLHLLLFFFVTNLVGNISWILFQPMVLAKTGNDEILLGTVMGLGGVGGLIGGVATSIWGGPKRRARGIVLGISIGLGAGGIIAGLNGGVVVWALGIFLWTATDAPVMGASQSIWQSKVPAALQGRVFSVRFFIALVGSLPAMLFAGPLADRVFEPLMANASGPLAWVVGSGPGAGMGLIILITGAIMVVASLMARSSKALWNVETLLPDHEEDEEEEDDDDDRGEGGDDGDGPGEPGSAVLDVGGEVAEGIVGLQ